MQRRSFVMSSMALPLAAHQALAAVTPPATTQGTTTQGTGGPLLMRGKRSLFQRVIIRPGAMLYPHQAGGTPRPVPGFTVFYVYDRRRDPQQGGLAWLQVGRGLDGKVEGWIAADKAIDWAHTMVAAFTNPAGRAPVLFLESEIEARRLILDARAGERAQSLLQAARAQRPGPVVAVEPSTFVDMSKHFYLLPILKADEITPEVGVSLRLLEVVSATADAPGPAVQEPARPADYKAVVVFVIDTTLSMQPYIDRTRNAVRAVVRAIGASAAAENFRFGLIGYRDSLADSPGLEYAAKVFATPEFSQPLQAIEAAISDVRESPASSTSFDEDPIFGLKTAIEGVEWKNFDARYIVLVTDAGARGPTHPNSLTGMDIPEIRALLSSQRIAVFAIHLLTPAGRVRNNHDKAREQYRQLTATPGTDALYYAVPEGAPESFADTVTKLSATLVRRAAETAGRPVAGLPEATDERMAQQVAVVSEAMRLAWLGRVEGARAPDVVHGFTTDRDLANREVASLDVHVLLTRNQLSDLQMALRRILETGLAGGLAPEKFFTDLRTAFAAAARDPARIGQLERLGNVLGEYLEGLPYQSQIMEITEADWLAMGAVAQSTVLYSIEGKLRLYQEYAMRTDLWVDLGGTRSPGEAMYPVPIDDLP
jgi:hypothetical protein